MLKTYRSLLSIPHARAFVLAGFVARLSISMQALGAVLMVSELTGFYGLAGAVAAAALLGEAVAAPRLGRLVDRYGQRRVLLVTTEGRNGSADGDRVRRSIGRALVATFDGVRSHVPTTPTFVGSTSN